jgi:hypothetical protein
MKLLLIDAFINISLAVFVALSISIPWAIIYILIYFAITKFVIEYTDVSGGAFIGITFEVIKDAASLGFTIFFNTMFESISSSLERLLSSHGESTHDNAEQLLSLGKYDGLDILAQEGETLSTLSASSLEMGSALNSYNNVFLDFNALDITIYTYVLARIILLLWLLKNSNK